MGFFVDEINECLWDYLKSTDKKIVLYGMGDGAVKVAAALEAVGARVDDIMASDDFVRGHSFMGIRVKKLSEIEQLYGDNFIILTCFGTQLSDVMDSIAFIEGRHELYAPCVPVAGELASAPSEDGESGLFDLAFVKKHRAELKKAYDLLADEQSKKVFEGIVRYKLSGKPQYLRDIETPAEEKFDLLRIGTDEVYVDLGAYNGDTVVEFLNETSLQFRKIYAMEPDPKNYRKMKRRLYMIGSALLEAYNCGAWDEDTTLKFSLRGGRSSTVVEPDNTPPPKDRRARMRAELYATNPARFREVKMLKTDSMMRGAEATYIKLDVEGAEARAIDGARETIANFHPKLNIAVYHRNEDIFALPLKINEISRRYHIYLRHHPYIPDWDTNMYCL